MSCFRFRAAPSPVSKRLLLAQQARPDGSLLTTDIPSTTSNFPTPGTSRTTRFHVARNGQLIAIRTAVTMKGPWIRPRDRHDLVGLCLAERQTRGRGWHFLDYGQSEQAGPGAHRMAHARQGFLRQGDRSAFEAARLQPDPLVVRASTTTFPRRSASISSTMTRSLPMRQLPVDCKLVAIDPIVRKSYQYLEYSPLVNARAPQLGKQRQILKRPLCRAIPCL